jgi:hypothetical protein
MSTRDVEVSAVTIESKPGLLTTEFWVMVVVVIVFFLDACGAWGIVRDAYDAIIIAVTVGTYILSRGIAKHGVPFATITRPTRRALWWYKA